MLKTKGKTKAHLGQQIHELSLELSKLKQSKLHAKPEDRPKLNKSYQETKNKLAAVKAKLKELNTVNPATSPSTTVKVPKREDRPPAYYYWFFVAAKQYLPQQVLKAIEAQAFELLTKHIN